MLSGEVAPTSGRITYDGYDMHRQRSAVARRVGVVPQDDVVHTRLTARSALSYAAKLRLPDDTDAAARRRRVAETLADSRHVHRLLRRFGPLEIHGEVQWIVHDEDVTPGQYEEAGMGIRFIYREGASRNVVRETVERLMVDSLGQRLYTRLMDRSKDKGGEGGS